MNTGQIISGVGHIGLIGWMLFGGSFRSDPLPFEVTDVAVISSDAFEAMLAGTSAPETVTEVAMPEPPKPEETPEPEVAEAPPPEPAPEPRPEPVKPEPPVQEEAVLAPEESPKPQTRPVPRVAPEPVAKPPEPEVKPDTTTQPETADTPAEVVRPKEEATAQKEAVTELTPEAKDEVTTAPTKSLRPKLPPVRTAAAQPAAKPDAKPAETPKADGTRDAIAAALAAASSDSESGGGSPGAGSDPLTQGEQDGLITALENIWVVDPYAASGKVTVIVAVKLNRDGTLAGTPRMVSSSGGDGAAVEVAFRNARAALIELSRKPGGFPLPAEKYDEWKEINITFNPDRMRLE